MLTDKLLCIELLPLPGADCCDMFGDELWSNPAAKLASGAFLPATEGAEADNGGDSAAADLN